jgi:MYXO-CTERM domain-containing protein
MSGPIEISLHRVVNGELAEAILTMEPDIQEDGSTLILFEPDSDLLEFTDYAFAMGGELDSPIYTTGDTYAVGMMDEAPILEIISMYYRTLSEGVFSIDTLVNVTPAIDDDALSYIELFNSEQPDVPLTAMLPGIGDMVRGMTRELAEHTDGSCYFVVQTDTLGNESAPSDEICAVPSSLDSTSGGCACSSGSGSASWLASLFAVGVAMVRRRR